MLKLLLWSLKHLDVWHREHPQFNKKKKEEKVKENKISVSFKRNGITNTNVYNILKRSSIHRASSKHDLNFRGAYGFDLF